MKNVFFLFTCMLMLSFKMMAQTEHTEKNDRVESLKIAFITDKLELTAKEASAFWPVYNEYSEQLKKIRNKEKEQFKKFSLKINPTDQESEQFTHDHFTVKQQQLDLTRRYIGDFKKVLPPAKAARIIILEHEFKMHLLQQLKEKKD